MCALKAFVIFGCLLSVVLARPQFNWNDLFVPVPNQQQQQQRQPQGSGFNPTNPFLPPNTGNNPNGVSSTTAAPANAAPSPQYLACLQSCPTTSEYNPVCGSDTQNYHNNGRLQCAQGCGQNVVMVRMGTCRPLA